MQIQSNQSETDLTPVTVEHTMSSSHGSIDSRDETKRPVAKSIANPSLCSTRASTDEMCWLVSSMVNKKKRKIGFLLLHCHSRVKLVLFVPLSLGNPIYLNPALTAFPIEIRCFRK